MSDRLLRRVTTISLPAVTYFVAADYFKKDISDSAIVKIGFISANFRKYFLGKIEERVRATTLAVDVLPGASVDASIRAELGEQREAIALAHLWKLMKSQPNGKKGVLLVNGSANIFYVVDIDGNVGAMFVRWDWSRGGWGINAGSVVWYGGSRVFSQVG